MPRIILSDPQINQNLITIRDEKAAYISVVMRCLPGDLLDISDGCGNSYRARILRSDRKAVDAEILEKRACNTESFLNIRLFQGLLKGEKMDLVIQKTVELGVKEIIPVITERSQVRETRKLLRWQKIAEEASRQSGRSVIPVIHGATTFDRIFTAVSKPGRKGIVFWEKGGEQLHHVFETMKDTLDIDILTGPEGGLSGNEVNSAVDNGFVAATLGKRILRAETAAISAVSLVQYALGDLGTLTA